VRDVVDLGFELIDEMEPATVLVEAIVIATLAAHLRLAARVDSQVRQQPSLGGTGSGAGIEPTSSDAALPHEQSVNESQCAVSASYKVLRIRCKSTIRVSTLTSFAWGRRCSSPVPRRSADSVRSSWISASVKPSRCTA